MSIKCRGFVFEQINVFGRDIPCKSCIEEVWGELSKSSQLELHTYSNEVVSKLKEGFNPSLGYTQLDRNFLVSGYFQIDRSLCKLISFDFPKLIQCNFIYRWFISLIGNFPGNRMQKVRKLMPTIISLQTSWEISDSRKKTYMKSDSLPDYSNLDKHSEYLDAKNTLNLFNSLVDFRCEINPLAFHLRRQKGEIIHKIATLSEGETGTIIVFCPFCRCLSIEAQTTRQNVHCESAQCKAAYSTSLNASKYKRTDWVKDPNVSPKLCVGECKSRQKGLNNQRYCRSCWNKIPTP